MALISVVLLSSGGISLAAAQQTRIAIAVDPEGRTCVLGGGVDGKFLNADRIIKLLKPRQDFRLYGLRGRQSAILWPIGPPQKVDENICIPHFRQQLSLSAAEIGKAWVAIFDKSGSKRIAILPKTLTILKNDNKKYTKILAAFLKRQKLNDVPLKIYQLIQTDLDGDGNLETIINAINTARAMDRKGEYSVVLVVREENGKSVVEAIQNEVTLKDSDFPVALWENTIAAIADIEGDGKMEIIMYGQYYHGQGWDLVRGNGLSSERPVICGCGG